MQIIRDIFPNEIPVLVDAVKYEDDSKLPDVVKIHPLIEGDDGVVRVGEAMPWDMEELLPVIPFAKLFPEEKDKEEE
jgi:hypothetical protein|tara:strand:+ start:613 stop:843 length:231 start_codon:yes stop_codon:yes gene_type:complete